MLYVLYRRACDSIFIRKLFEKEKIIDINGNHRVIFHISNLQLPYFPICIFHLSCNTVPVLCVYLSLPFIMRDTKRKVSINWQENILRRPISRFPLWRFCLKARKFEYETECLILVWNSVINFRIFLKSNSFSNIYEVRLLRNSFLYCSTPFSSKIFNVIIISNRLVINDFRRQFK